MEPFDESMIHCDWCDEMVPKTQAKLTGWTGWASHRCDDCNKKLIEACESCNNGNDGAVAWEWFAPRYHPKGPYRGIFCR